MTFVLTRSENRDDVRRFTKFFEEEFTLGSGNLRDELEDGRLSFRRHGLVHPGETARADRVAQRPAVTVHLDVSHAFVLLVGSRTMLSKMHPC